MYEVKDVSDWELNTEVTALGRRPKEWLIEPITRRSVLLKLPHYHSAEAAAEKVASELGKLYGVPTADTDLAHYQGRHGIISHKFVATDEVLVDGGDLIVARHPAFDRRRSRSHSFQLVREVLPAPQLPQFIELLVFDAVIGNSDRHQDNWSVILARNDAPRLAPSYDHGSSLGRDISDNAIEEHLRENVLERYALRGRSRVSWDDVGGGRPMAHVDLLRNVQADHPGEVYRALDKVLSPNLADVRSRIEPLPDTYASPQRRALMIELVEHRRRLLSETLNGPDPVR